MRKGIIVLLLGLLGVLGTISYYCLVQGKILSAAEAHSSYDLVIKHALILDGTGEKKLFRGDIAIRAGEIVEMGYIPEKQLRDVPKESVFDAGGLMAMPFPVTPEKTAGVVEHVFRTSYPRYPAHYLYFQEEPYAGCSLAQVARQRGETPEQTFAYLRNLLPVSTKVYLVPIELAEEKIRAGDFELPELVASCTGYLAEIMEKEKRGKIKKGCRADLYFFKTHDYGEKALSELFLKGELPSLAVCCREGKLQKPEEQDKQEE